MYGCEGNTSCRGKLILLPWRRITASIYIDCVPVTCGNTDEKREDVRYVNRDYLAQMNDSIRVSLLLGRCAC